MDVNNISGTYANVIQSVETNVAPKQEPVAVERTSQASANIENQASQKGTIIDERV